MREFEQVLAWLRELAWPCAPPIGIGEFEVLYASAAEVVVWYSPAREGHRAGEVAVPCARLSAAWERLVAGDALDESALAEIGAGLAGGRWLLALLALLPGTRVQPDPLTLAWEPAPARPASSPRPRRGSAIAPQTTATPGRAPRRSRSPAVAQAAPPGEAIAAQPQKRARASRAPAPQNP